MDGTLSVLCHFLLGSTPSEVILLCLGVLCEKAAKPLESACQAPIDVCSAIRQAPIRRRHRDVIVSLLTLFLSEITSHASFEKKLQSGACCDELTYFVNTRKNMC